MSENWWHAGIMPCVRSDLERDKPVAYIFWLLDGPKHLSPLIPDIILITSRRMGSSKKFLEPPALLAQLGVKADG